MEPLRHGLNERYDDVAAVDGLGLEVRRKTCLALLDIPKEGTLVFELLPELGIVAGWGVLRFVLAVKLFRWKGPSQQRGGESPGSVR